MTTNPTIKRIAEQKYKYMCPDCGVEHNEEHHPPYCQSCIFSVTL